MVTNRLLFVLGIAAMLATCPVTSEANPAAAWDAFKLASFTDIVITPAFEDGITVYELAMGSDPTVTFGGNTYDVNWIQGVFAVGLTEATDFTATEGTNSLGWKWDAKESPGESAGYHGEGTDRLEPGDDPMEFSYATFVAAPGSVIPGFHLAYQDGGEQKTDWFKVVPEPSSLVMLGGPLLGSLALMRRRLRRR